MKAQFSFSVVLAVLFLASATTEKKNDFFEGKITYQTYTREADGKLIPSKTIGKQEYYFKNTFSKFNMQLKKQGMDNLNYTEIVVNTQDTSSMAIARNLGEQHLE